MATHCTTKVLVAGCSLVGLGVAIYWWNRKRDTAKDDSYETPSQVNQYMAFHYAPAEEYFLYPFGPKEHVDFPKRCAELCIKHRNDVVLNRALDLGCAVGRSTFELSRHFNEAIGIDFSFAFIEKCNEMKEVGYSSYVMPDEGKLGLVKEAFVEDDIDRSKVHFQQGDACNLDPNLGQFGCVLAANLICRLPEPMSFLEALPRLVVPGGIVVITSPYTWMKDYTPESKWIGGYIDPVSGEHVTGFSTLQSLLEPNFTLEEALDLPFIIKETHRKHQWTVAHATVWKRRE